MDDITPSVITIGVKLHSLSEPALKGIAFEARSRAADKDSGSKLWSGLAEAADVEREILARNRTGRGVWYAVVEIWQEEPSYRDDSRLVATWNRQCKGQKAAHLALKDLIPMAVT